MMTQSTTFHLSHAVLCDQLGEVPADSMNLTKHAKQPPIPPRPPRPLSQKHWELLHHVQARKPDTHLTHH